MGELELGGIIDSPCWVPFPYARPKKKLQAGRQADAITHDAVVLEAQKLESNSMMLRVNMESQDDKGMGSYA
jgi:hypothetical protein